MTFKISQEICPKCEGLVAFHEDSILLRGIATNNSDIVCKGSRHILCDPSFGQYIDHPDFPTIYDERKKYDKRKGNHFKVGIREEIITKAWLHLQIKCGITLNSYETNN